MDILPILFDAEFVLLVITLVILAKKEAVARFERRVIRWIRRRKKQGIRCTDGHIVSGGPVPQMTAEEIVRICNEL
jgi:hypothetical protein